MRLPGRRQQVPKEIRRRHIKEAAQPVELTGRDADTRFFQAVELANADPQRTGGGVARDVKLASPRLYARGDVAIDGVGGRSFSGAFDRGPPS
jgi:hypothetical protein